MRVAVYHPWIYLKGGAERTLLELVRRSRHAWTVYTNHYDREGTFPEFADLDVVELGRVSVRRTALHAGLAAARVLAQSIPLNDTAALMISSEGLGNLAVLRPRGVPVFSFCHTPLKVMYDPFTRERFFNQQRPGLATRGGLGLYAAVDRLSWDRYQRVFCNSQEVARRVLGARLAPPDRVDVIHPGVDPRHFDSDGPFEPFFLLAGRIARTKNVELGIDAFIEMERRTGRDDFRLVIAGMVDDKSRPYLAELRERAAGNPRIEFVVSPSDEVLRELYRRCCSTLFTALNEDWGIVVLEGMASGKPVIAVARGGPLESVVHQETGLLCPAEVPAFAEAMASLVDNPARAQAWGRMGRQHVGLFPWESLVNPIDDCVEALARHAVMGARTPMMLAGRWSA
jgi:glycosyltransferase involved in cell wall biosynthesis